MSSRYSNRSQGRSGGYQDRSNSRGGSRGGSRGRGRGGYSRNTNSPVPKQNLDLQVNLLNVNFPNKFSFYQYDVEFSPQMNSKRLSLELVNIWYEKVKNKFKNMKYIFDGRKLLFSETLLVKSMKESTSEKISHNNKEYVINITLTEVIDTKEKYEKLSMQIFSIMLRQSQLEKPDSVQIRRDIFHKNTIPINKELSMFEGFGGRFYKTEDGLSLNANVIFKIIKNMSVLDLLNQFKRDKVNNKEIEKLLKKRTAITKYQSKDKQKISVIIDGIDWKKTPSHKFTLKDGTDISFAEYVKNQYGSKNIDMKQPLVFEKKERKDSQGNKIIITNYYIPQLLQVTGLTKEEKDDRFLKEAIKEKRPNNVRDLKNKILSEARGDIDSSKNLKDYKIKVDTSKFVNVEGTRLESQNVVFANKKVNVGDGAFINFKDAQFFGNGNIKDWLLVYQSRDQNNTYSFVENIKKGCEGFNIKFEYSDEDNEVGNNVSDYADSIDYWCKQNKYQFVLCVLPNKDQERYSLLKQACIDNDVPCQCVVASTIRNPKKAPSVASKIAVQIAAKMEYAPWTMEFNFNQKLPPMIAGMDVYHSGEIGKKTKKSVLGFVASLDKDVKEYYSCAKIHDAGREIVKGQVAKCMKEALEAYKKRNKSFPKRIYFYRDGVGFGQKKEMYESEVQEMKKVFGMLGMKDTQLVFIIVLKRISIKFFQGDQNPRPGTVVNSMKVVSNDDNQYEFFLVAQNVTQGVANPVKYQVIEGFNHVKRDEIHDLTYKLCHMYYNWNGTIKVPGVCMYAHKIADYTGQHIKHEITDQRIRFI